ncbi:MAG: cobalamin biosynthesis protein [Lachnospiraceae bacterium]|nr:cobalamin biosynthesis protein [Lachnospiraceae bacterium]
MSRVAVCFSANGAKLISRLNCACEEKSITTFIPHAKTESRDIPEEFIRVESDIHEWTLENFVQGNEIVFVGAMGIAVRALSGLPKDKLSDCPVVVIDDGGRFAVPVLSGHAGGANKLAEVLAYLLDAVPVITTSSDVNEVFSVDTFAVENRLTIAEKSGIKNVSSRALENKKVTLSIKDFPPEKPVDVVVADKTDAEHLLLLRPKMYTVGIGMKKDKDPESLEEFFLKTIGENGMDVSDVYALCTIDIKEDEPALTALRDKYRIPVISFDADLLNKAPGEYTASEFVRRTTGVDNVCERAAVLGSGCGELILRKTAGEGMTIAIARRSGFKCI